MSGERQPVLYAYCRVSTRGQALKGKSLEEQQQQLEAHFKWIVASSAEGKVPLWGGIYRDAGVSAHKIPFAQREAGGVLAGRLLPGDHVAMISLDRGFRNFKDAVATIEGWIERGIVVHLLDFKLSTDSIVGSLVMRVLAAAAQFQRDMTRERTRAILATLHAEGRLQHLARTFGWRYVNGGTGRGKLIPDTAERETVREIVRLHDEEGMSWERMATHFRERRIFTLQNVHSCGNRDPIAKKGEWAASTIRRAYFHYKANPTFRNEKLEAMLAAQAGAQIAQ